MNIAAFVFIAVFTLAGALAAAVLPRLIHAALCLVLAFLGVAAFYLLLGAEFVGLAQVLVYVGAVAVLIVFTILLTQREDEERTSINWGGASVAALVFLGLLWAVENTPSLTGMQPSQATLTAQQIGTELMAEYVWPLQCIGLLLTATLIGTLVIVMEEKR
jgi:NADH-quinone oxidoreductase subunit J